MNTQHQVGPDSRTQLSNVEREDSLANSRWAGSRLAARGSTNVSEIIIGTIQHYLPPPPNSLTSAHHPIASSLLKHRLDVTRRLLSISHRRIPLNTPPPCTLHHLAPFAWEAHRSYRLLTLPRYIFRRAAARAVAAPRQIRIAPRVSSFQSSIPSLSRSFHQSRIWRAEEQKSEAETTSGTASRSGASSDIDAVSESSGTTSEPLGQSEHQTESQTESISEKASDLAQKAQETASDAAAKVQETASDAAAKAAQAVGEISPSTDKVQETASQVTESAQATASTVGRQTRDAVDAHNPFKSHNQSAPAPPTKILYIGNLFFEVTAPQLEAEFAKYGEVTNSRVVTDNRGLSKGFAYIEFANQEQANDALNALDQKVFQGRRLSVQYHKRRTPGGRERENRTIQGSNTPSETLFIGNMSYQMSDKDLNGRS